jgi:hypothetical protein
MENQWLNDICVPESLKHPKHYENATTLDLVGYRQTDEYSCGFIAGLMVFQYFYPDKSVEDFHKLVNPSEETGTSARRLMAALRKSGISVGVRKRLSFDELAALVESGKPVITTIDVGEYYHHWVAIYGVARLPKRVYVAGNIIPSWKIFSDKHVVRWSHFDDIWRAEYSVIVCSKKENS